jgi:hypothetical protein
MYSLGTLIPLSSSAPLPSPFSFLEGLLKLYLLNHPQFICYVVMMKSYSFQGLCNLGNRK